ncbi:hypothetical protein Aple_078690 [Acrocarpospora pleiomorpha]|uniref:Peptidase M15C domain-containing protein n=1 Tax=Acrocarpospora pleiomorpha TaxID=90975 RepID=A0A5M3XVN0_9ACTN|nr:M15 family metallopeptidase [Acrocarpospora pleiomorpha]GES24970.1 hypothetical protein Aple_078690 [Acrocarpospora pleiomorpha]
MPTSRRLFLHSAVGLALAAGAGAMFPGVVVARSSGRFVAGSSAEIQSSRKSPNGWPINTAADGGGSVWSRPVPGTGFEVAVAIGAAEVILVHVVRRFHYEIDSLRPGEVLGFKSPDTLTGYEENHASGTAIDIRPGHYPPGVRGGFYEHEVNVVRDILADCDGVVTWGGDFGVPDEGHFQIDLPPADERVYALAEKLRGWNNTPGEGAGVIRSLN